MLSKTISSISLLILITQSEDYDCSSTSCQSDTLTCSSSPCSFNCNGENGCRNAELYCLDGSDCTITTGSLRSCTRCQVFCPDDATCDIEGSGGDLSFRSANVTCGENSDCLFNYFGSDAVNGIQFDSIFGQDANYLFVRRNGFVRPGSNVPLSKIYCPTNAGKTNEPQENCAIDCVVPNSVNLDKVNETNPCGNMNIYATHGFNDVVINDTTNGANLTLFCGDNYEYSCTVMAPNVTKCTESSECDYVDPTNQVLFLFLFLFAFDFDFK